MRLRARVTRRWSSFTAGAAIVRGSWRSPTCQHAHNRLHHNLAPQQPPHKPTAKPAALSTPLLRQKQASAKVPGRGWLCTARLRRGSTSGSCSWCRCCRFPQRCLRTTAAFAWGWACTGWTSCCSAQDWNGPIRCGRRAVVPEDALQARSRLATFRRRILLAQTQIHRPDQTGNASAAL